MFMCHFINVLFSTQWTPGLERWRARCWGRWALKMGRHWRPCGRLGRRLDADWTQTCGNCGTVCDSDPLGASWLRGGHVAWVESMSTLTDGIWTVDVFYSMHSMCYVVWRVRLSGNTRVTDCQWYLALHLVLDGGDRLRFGGDRDSWSPAFSCHKCISLQTPSNLSPSHSSKTKSRFKTMKDAKWECVPSVLGFCGDGDKAYLSIVKRQDFKANKCLAVAIFQRFK